MPTETEIRFEPSNLENIDGAMLDFLRSLNLHSQTNKGFVPIPVVWVGAERSYQIKENQNLRDKNGVLILPQMTLERRGFTKKLDYKGIYWGHVPRVDDYKGGAVEITRRINHLKTAAFQNADSLKDTKGRINFRAISKPEPKIVYSIVSTPIPVYLDMEYVIAIRAEYQTQINELVSPFLTQTGAINGFVVERNGHKYECFYEPSQKQENNTLNYDDEERSFVMEIPIKVLGYIVGDEANEIYPKKTIRENRVEIAITEVILTGSLA